MKVKRVFFLIVLAVAGFSAFADEGMWLPSLIGKLNIDRMRQMGCELTAEDIYNINGASLKDAVGALDHGSCTAELVSADGLLLTNHHCGFGEIQAHSSVEHDYLRDGFWAATRAEELPNPGKSISFLVRMDDVTAQVLTDSVRAASDEAAVALIAANVARIQADAVKGTHYEARVRPLYNENQYFLFVYETFRDVRLVGAPPESLGKFGGDTDNWEWPRQTCDFSMFRVYCSPDGKPADYSADNVPYHPKNFLPISLHGYNEGDFAMVMGFPGRTDRYKPAAGINYTMTVTNPVRIQVREKKLAILRDYMASSQKAAIQYATKYSHCSNYYKYSIGQNKGLKDLDVIAKKQATEQRFIEWAGSTAQRRAAYGDAMPLIMKAYEYNEDERALEYMEEALFEGPEIIGFALAASQIEEALDSLDRKQLAASIEWFRGIIDDYFKDYDAATDQKLLATLFKLYSDNVGADFHPKVFAETIQKKYKGNFDLYAEQMFKKSIFASRERLDVFLENPTLKALRNDMAYKAATSIYSEYQVVSAISGESLSTLRKGRRLFLAGLMAMNPTQNFAPDANSTLRLTYGKVGGYIPRDGVVYEYCTTLKGYLEKEIPGDTEFDVPARLKELYAARDYGRYADRDGALHTCFLTDNDITGGNSGSPVMNARGELLGLAFDGNWEAMSGDFAFEKELQKCIAVDIRFVLWVIDKYAGAGHLINEMLIRE
ncbi:MAG: S46 family peptidase [Bacteroidales bacterium]|jgi:hypothetical protein|nr:S46 family peptidase [Bacteroidales bacterium]